MSSPVVLVSGHGKGQRTVSQHTNIDAHLQPHQLLGGGAFGAHVAASQLPCTSAPGQQHNVNTARTIRMQQSPLTAPRWLQAQTHRHGMDLLQKQLLAVALEGAVHSPNSMAEFCTGPTRGDVKLLCSSQPLRTPTGDSVYLHAAATRQSLSSAQLSSECGDERSASVTSPGRHSAKQESLMHN